LPRQIVPNGQIDKDARFLTFMAAHALIINPLGPISSAPGPEIAFNQRNQTKYSQIGKLPCDYTEVFADGINYNANKEMVL
jgi:hypothetical protein